MVTDEDALSQSHKRRFGRAIKRAFELIDLAETEPRKTIQGITSRRSAAYDLDNCSSAQPVLDVTDRTPHNMLSMAENRGLEESGGGIGEGSTRGPSGVK
jgi:hypothetical protein